MKKIRIIALFLAILGISGYFLFDHLGGNRPVVLSLEAKSPDTLTGKTFRGTPIDKGLEAVFQTIQGTQKLHPGTSLHTIYYVEPAGKLDTLEVFAGINLPFGTQNLEVKKFTETQYILAKVTGNKWVMPGPETIKKKIQDYAKANKLTLSGYFIDKIVSETEVHVIAPVQ
jgi:hypothetical protein